MQVELSWPLENSKIWLWPLFLDFYFYSITYIINHSFRIGEKEFQHFFSYWYLGWTQASLNSHKVWFYFQSSVLNGLAQEFESEQGAREFSSSARSRSSEQQSRSTTQQLEAKSSIPPQLTNTLEQIVGQLDVLTQVCNQILGQDHKLIMIEFISMWQTLCCLRVKDIFCSNKIDAAKVQL